MARADYDDDPQTRDCPKCRNAVGQVAYLGSSANSSGFVLSDYGAVESPVTGQMVEGRAAMREHLKRHNCRILEPSERKNFGI
ncbi:MAG: hypothetical protein GC149_20375 [Gammaproteobacteria bacterium]|nr:hypothetical protein [Gammaproteobacteria bacterium]